MCDLYPSKNVNHASCPAGKACFEICQKVLCTITIAKVYLFAAKMYHLSTSDT
eukprot:UN15865